MKRLETAEVIKALQEAKGNPDSLAKLLGVSKSHAYYLIRNNTLTCQAAPVTPTAAPTTPATTHEPQTPASTINTE